MQILHEKCRVRARPVPGQSPSGVEGAPIKCWEGASVLYKNDRFALSILIGRIVFFQIITEGKIVFLRFSGARRYYKIVPIFPYRACLSSLALFACQFWQVRHPAGALPLDPNPLVLRYTVISGALPLPPVAFRPPQWDVP